MSNLLFVQETYVNSTEGHMIGESDWYETYTDDRGKLFRDMQREYGRCVSKMYVDQGSNVTQTGWVFEKIMGYEDKPEKKYTREVWVRVSTTPVERHVSFDSPNSPWATAS